MPGKVKLEYRDVSFAYRGQKKFALQRIDFSVSEGETVALLGRSGAGKSTFVRCASGLVPRFYGGAYAGEVLVEGDSIRGRRVAELADKVGTLFQDFESQLFSTNVRLECAFGMENLGIDRKTMVRRIDAVGKLVGISHLMDREPQSLSGGQKQRLAFASILCLDPSILLCDEPTTDLDPQGRSDLFRVLTRLRGENHAIVVVESDTERLLDFDRVVVLTDGCKAAEGPPSEVLGDVGLCRKNGLAVPQLFEVFAGLGLAQRPIHVRDAVTILKREGFAALSAPLHPAREDPQPPLDRGVPAVITIDGLHFSYIPGVPVLRGISLELGEGEYLAILGSNGSGKTTLVKHMIGLLSAQSGRVLLRGEPVEKIERTVLGRKIGFVFQNPDHMLFAATAFEEIAFGLRNFGFSSDEISRKTKWALEVVGLAGLESVDPFTMTKGDRQKLAVACVLACDPELIILDEPTTGLGMEERLRMMELLDELHHAGRTIIIITHSMEIAAVHARRIVVLESGAVIADRSPRGVFGSPDLLNRAGLEMPACTELGRHFGVCTLTVAELVSGLGAKAKGLS